MKIYLIIIALLLTQKLFSNEVEVIELHENKSIDQMVLDQIENKNQNNEDIVIIEQSEENITNNNEETKIKISEPVLENSNIESVDVSWNNIDPEYVNNILNNAKNIKSTFLQQELNSFLSNLNLDYAQEDNRKIYYIIVNYFYKIGNLSKAYNLIKQRDFNEDENLSFYNLIELNYLLSTFQLDNACNFKDELNAEINKNNNIVDKIDIFCLILQNKLSEAQLLNSILLETEKNLDYNFQELFLYLTDKNKLENNQQFSFSENINSSLIFLYSAMARIAEIPLNEDFLNVDAKNMAIPIILNKSSPIDLRIKAANQSFLEKNISVDSLAALYQSVDFNSDQLNNSKETIKKLSGNVDLLMSYYYQLINVQIFPSERLEVLVNFWEFTKKHNLEDLAYSITYKILDSIEISSDYLKYSPHISIAYIYNEDFEKALKWINFYETSNGIDDKSTLARILLNLYSSNNINSIVEIINSNFDKLIDTNNKINEELIFVLYDILEDYQTNELNKYFNNIYDERLMPSIFIIENLNKAIKTNNSDDLLIYTILSLNNKNWKDIHPIHLKLILNGYLNHENNEHIKSIILEIFNSYKIL